MSTTENYLQSITALNDRMWAEARPLEKQLRELEAEHRIASTRPITDVVSRGVAAMLMTKINPLVTKLNTIYEDWQRNLTLFTPPPPTINPKSFPPPPSPGPPSKKIPWPRDIPPDVKRFISRVIDQQGIPITKRVALTYANGGVVVEFAKW